MSKSDTISSEQFFNDITQGYEELEQFLHGDLKLRVTYVKTVDSAPAEVECGSQYTEPGMIADASIQVREAVSIHELQKELHSDGDNISKAKRSVRTKSINSKVAASQKQS